MPNGTTENNRRRGTVTAWHCGTGEYRNDGDEGHVSERGQILHNETLCGEAESCAATSHSVHYVTLAQTFKVKSSGLVRGQLSNQ